MKNEKVLSIVIPTYNIEKYIKKCLNSFINDELLPLIEIIIVNDGSTDNSSNLAKEFSKKYPLSFIVIDKENGGHGSTINTALGEATGKFFMVVDGDDWVDSKALLKVIKKIQEDTSIDAAFFNYIMDIELNNEQKKRDLDKIFDEGKIELDKANINLYRQPSIHNIIYKTDNLRKIKMTLDEKIFYVDVEYMMYPLSTINKAIYIDEYVYHYLIGRAGQSVDSKTAPKHIDDTKKVVISVLEFFNTNKNKKLSRYAKKTYLMTMSRVINDYYGNILIFRKDTYADDIKDLDKKIEKLDNELYNFVAKKFFYINIARKSNYNHILINIAYFIDRNLKRVQKLCTGNI